MVITLEGFNEAELKRAIKLFQNKGFKLMDYIREVHSINSRYAIPEKITVTLSGQGENL